MTTSQIQNIMMAFGGIFFALGLLVRLGIWKNWFWKQQRMVYGYIPLGLLFIYFSFNEQAQERLGTNHIYFQGFAIILFLVGIWWSARPPSFVKPGWVRWIEAHPKRVVEAMQAAAGKNDEWKEKVKSKQAVDNWARGIMLKMPRSVQKKRR